MDMTINNVSLADYGATLLSAKYGYAKVTNYEDWMRGAKNPLFFGQDITYTTIKFTILVEGTDLADVDKKCSNVAAAMSKATIKVDKAPWSVEGHIVSIDDSNRISIKAREMEIDFEGVKVADRETITQALSFGAAYEFEAKGNQIVPCRIEMTPDMGYAEMILTLNDETFKIKTISTAAKQLIIDSELGVVTLDGANKIEDYLSWSLPHIKGGKNKIQVNGAPVVRISYNGRWM